MNNRVLVLKGLSAYNVLRRATDEVVKGFEKEGYEVDVLDLLGAQADVWTEVMRMVFSRNYDFMFSCQALTFENYLHQTFPLPCYAWLFDDPLYHYPRVLAHKRQEDVLFTIDGEHGEIIKKLVPESGEVCQLIHGGFPGDGHWTEVDIKAKDIDILYPMTIPIEPLLEEYITNPMPVQTFLIEQGWKRLLQNSGESVWQALENVLKAAGEELTPDLIRELYDVITYLDAKIRFKEKREILIALLKAGFTVHMAGNGDPMLGEAYKGQIVAHGPLDIDELVALMARSKIVMNPLGTFISGIHERICTALLQGAVCFTPDFSFAKHTFGNRVKYYERGKFKEVIPELKECLEHFGDYEEFLKDNRQYALENHTWEKRGQEIASHFRRKIGA